LAHVATSGTEAKIRTASAALKCVDLIMSL
jgi:hypothetical protein